jgi:tRNA dimethylallyltransferase
VTDAHGPAGVARVIIGPTAAGKSTIAMQLAERYNLAIISADSRQVYRGFDIGTAKPAREEQERVPHYGIDVLDPGERYSAHAWARDAARWWEDARSRGREPVVVGGTGFYVRALVQPFDEAPALDPDRRATLAPWLDALDPPELERWCRRLDPARASLGRTQRLRAVETALLTGRRLSDASTKPTGLHPVPSGVRYLVVDPGPVLALRIADRVRAMVAAGWPDEVRRLLTHVPVDAPAWQASGYARMRDAVTGVLTVQAAVERVIIETRQYAKRQRTWCRHQLTDASVTRLDSSASNALALACAWWESGEGKQT